ncbi:MAG: PAS domain S-box protein [Dehalococcoidia bacterium]
MSEPDDDEALRSLRASEELYSRVFFANPVAMAITDGITQRFSAANEAFLQLCGYWRADVIGRTSEELDLWPQREVRDDVAAELRDGGASGPHDGFMRTKPGELVACRVHFRLVVTSAAPFVLSTFIPT